MSVTADTLAALHEQLRELEIDAVLIRGRVEQLRATIAFLEAMPRRGRPAKDADVIDLPDRGTQGVNPMPPQTTNSMTPEPDTAA